MVDSSSSVILIFVPMVLGYIMSRICPVTKQAGQVLRWRPPGWVFGLVWPILYLCVGSAWYLAQANIAAPLCLNLTMGALMLFLNGWMYVYSCREDKTAGIYVLLGSCLLTLLVYTLLGDCTECQLLMCPLMTWIFFALLMNLFEVQTLNSE